MPQSRDDSLTSCQPPISEAENSLLNKTEPNVSPKLGNELRGGITFAGQDKLPKLPIPDLESTCQKYLDTLKPLQTVPERHNTVAAVQDFLNGEGPELQNRLKKYATGKTSYIEQFCMFLFSLK